HELGHLIFRLPDLYVSMYDVMSSGLWGAKDSDAYIGMTPVLPSAWTKSTLSWVTPIEAHGVQAVITAAGAPGGSNTVFRMSTRVPSQYFLVENRRNVGYDRGLQWSLGENFKGGAAIWHVDETVAYGNDSHRKVDLEEADGTADGGNTDLWYVGNRTIFNDTSVPNSRLYDGSSTYESIDVLTPSLFSMSILFSDADTCSGPGAEGTPCTDGDECTKNDACKAGVCTGDADPSCGEIVCGDGNGDGEVTASDALEALRVAVGSGSCPNGACDYNGSGEVTASDAQALLRVAVGDVIAPNCGAAEQRAAVRQTSY